ncbi:MAG: M48 family metallopeptidase [Pseudomonadota bacterium]|nr:M48 family metallopeptidase [Pseudomonadota bacterium]
MSDEGDAGILGKIGWLSRNWREPPTVKLAGRDVPITIRRMAQARRMTLRLARDGSVRLSIPTWARSADALSFVRSRADWLAGQLATLPRPTPIQPGGTLPYRGTALIVDWQATAPRRVVCSDGQLRIGGPAASLESRLRRWMEGEARRLLGADLAHYTALAGVTAPPLMLSNAQRRWGSCSAKGVVRVNWRLAMAPDHVRRSVVAHEVAHLLHFDHSPRFHDTLAKLFEGDIAAANLWLKREGRGLYLPFG